MPSFKEISYEHRQSYRNSMFRGEQRQHKQCLLITVDFLQAFLEDLDLCGAGKISAAAVATVARGCPRLAYLNLTWCVNVNDEALAVVAASCRRLRLLSVFGLRGVTDATLDELAQPGRCSATLATLDVHGCCNVKRQAEAELLKQFPKLTCFTHHS